MSTPLNTPNSARMQLRARYAPGGEWTASQPVTYWLHQSTRPGRKELTHATELGYWLLLVLSAATTELTKLEAFSIICPPQPVPTATQASKAFDALGKTQFKRSYESHDQLSGLLSVVAAATGRQAGRPPTVVNITQHGRDLLAQHLAGTVFQAGLDVLDRAACALVTLQGLAQPQDARYNIETLINSLRQRYVANRVTYYHSQLEAGAALTWLPPTGRVPTPLEIRNGPDRNKHIGIKYAQNDMTAAHAQPRHLWINWDRYDRTQPQPNPVPSRDPTSVPPNLKCLNYHLDTATAAVMDYYLNSEAIVMGERVYFMGHHSVPDVGVTVGCALTNHHADYLILSTICTILTGTKYWAVHEPASKDDAVLKDFIYNHLGQGTFWPTPENAWHATGFVETGPNSTIVIEPAVFHTVFAMENVILIGPQVLPFNTQSIERIAT